MVQLLIKGTTYPDEFRMEFPLDYPISAADVEAEGAAAGGPCAAVLACRQLNRRHQLRLMLLSARALAQECRPAPLSPEWEAYRDFVASAEAQVKQTTAPSTVAETEALIADLRERTAALETELTTHKDGLEAAIQHLYEQHEDPNLDEGRRLRVYHVRAIMDPRWREGEQLAEATAGLWFASKVMAGTFAAYCGRNERSRLTVKVSKAGEGAAAPSAEPRMSYDDQRALFAYRQQRRAAYETLEESELRDRVVRQARGAVALPGAGAGIEPEQLRRPPVRPTELP